ncbi:AAA family ATPase [bacterium]|nr:AAA family ATPase [bacterium]
MQKQLAPLAGDFDYCLLDCPPSLGALTGNAVWAADTILIPTSYSRFSLDGIVRVRDMGYKNVQGHRLQVE